MQPWACWGQQENQSPLQFGGMRQPFSSGWLEGHRWLPQNSWCGICLVETEFHQHQLYSHHHHVFFFFDAAWMLPYMQRQVILSVPSIHSHRSSHKLSLSYSVKYSVRDMYSLEHVPMEILGSCKDFLVWQNRLRYHELLILCYLSHAHHHVNAQVRRLLLIKHSRHLYSRVFFLMNFPCQIKKKRKKSDIF